MDGDSDGAQSAGTGLIDRVDRALDFVSTACLIFTGSLLVALIAMFGWLVFGRYVLNDTPTWVEQCSLLIVAYVTFVGAAVGVRRKAHLSIDFIRDGMSRWPREILRLVADLSVLAFALVMAWHGWKLTIAGLDRPIPLLGVSEAWRNAPLLISGVLIATFIVFDLIKRALRGEPEN